MEPKARGQGHSPKSPNHWQKLFDKVGRVACLAATELGFKPDSPIRRYLTLRQERREARAYLKAYMQTTDTGNHDNCIQLPNQLRKEVGLPVEGTKGLLDLCGGFFVLFHGILYTWWDARLVISD